MTTFPRCCPESAVSWWAFREDRDLSAYRCAGCGRTFDGPRYPENPALRVRVAA